ncbi:MAG: addiction module toxin, HicA family [Chloroflexi bacterium]|nr:MAG: addiction module toxin, HicA family [Chloroflexota bacterium]
MSRLPMISGDDFVRAVRKIGYELDHTTGSHMILRHPSRKRLSVPRHRELGRGILRRLIDQAGLNREEFLGLL